MLKTIFIGAICFAVGIIVTLSITSQPWLVTSLRHNFTWDNSREWFGALSGWAAALAAAFSIIYLMRQTKHAATQTDFVTGDTSPSATMFDPRETHEDEAFANRLEIINWNRHPILINRISLVGPAEVNLNATEVEDHEPVRKNQLTAELQRGRMLIPGWKDRSKAPTFAEFNLSILTSDDTLKSIAQNNIVRTEVTIGIDYTIAGPVYKKGTIQVSRNDARIVTA